MPPASRRIRCLLLVLCFLTTSPALIAQESSLSKAEPQPDAWGLGALIHPLQLNDLTLRERADAVSQDKKDRVHFILINGLDPLYSGNLNGLAAYYRSIGFHHTTCYQLVGAGKARRQIESIRRADPEARIVLLGYSLGANAARSLANNLQREGTHIDSLVYLGGDTVFNTPSSRPSNARRILNITAHGLILLGGDRYFKGEDIDGAVNHRVDIRHILLPVQRDTINLIGQELLTLASGASEPEPRRSTPAALE